MAPTGVSVAAGGPVRAAGRTAVRAVAALWLAALAARADVRPLSLYEKVGRSSLVLWGEVAESEDRFASIRTLEIIKCAIAERPGPAFRVAYRLDSFLRRPWEDRIEFAKGERVLLFLRPFTKQDGERTAPDLYTLLWGAQGKVVLPPEGEEAWVAAARRMSELLALSDLEKQARALQEDVASANPHVAEAALSEVLSQRLADTTMIPRLLPLLDAPREPQRLLALRALTAALKEARDARREVPDREDLSDRLRGRASTDASVEIRVEAIHALEALGGEEARSLLDRLSREDPSQMVRLEARKSLLGWKP